MKISLEDLMTKIIAKHGLTSRDSSIFYRDSNKIMRLSMTPNVLTYWGPNLPGGGYVTIHFGHVVPCVCLGRDSKDTFLKEVVEPIVFKREIAKLIATGDES